MCGRYTLLTDAQQLAAEFGLAEAVAFVQRYNIAPTQEVPVVRILQDAAGQEMAVIRQQEPGGERRLDVLRWGLVPHWSRDPKPVFRMINARAETVATQPAFRDAFRRRRCIVPASGFFEWQRLMKDGKEVKLPHYIRRRDGRPLALAGLWDRWQGADGVVVESFTIVTCEANELVRSLHDRMPVILDRADYGLWLDPASRPEDLLGLLRPCPAEWLMEGRVNPVVNNPRNDVPDCISDLP
ncbi:MAG: SOS response-associated peptidase [Phycisphaerales bacterium]|nr:SOS response-associated peptidase [Phycisphaerales bacterium]